MKTLLLATVLATIGQLALTACPSSSGGSGAPWREAGDACYQAVLIPSKWTLARDTCEKLHPGAHLATVTSDMETWHMFNSFRDDVDLTVCRSFFHWIGVTDIGHDDVFKLIDGGDYENWSSFVEPLHKPNQEDCGAISPHTGSWYGDPCANEHCFVCEVAAI
ncbi:lectin BRA-3-like [Patiria miniata]|uniref:C-type lectin domain-containing protein n=1 Tax=Patiria miniata TaxID=46514 RepID=A0A913ZZ37_PATMI|nr:lectin BRA-3-like [Patiria miniata]